MKKIPLLFETLPPPNPKTLTPKSDFAICKSIMATGSESSTRAPKNDLDMRF